MRNSYPLCALLGMLLFISFSQAQNVPPYVPTNGLVGWWPFTGNANDSSGNGNDGTVNGATLTTDRFGNVNSAFDFNTSSKIIVPNSSSLTVGNALTISLWYTQRTMVNTINYLLQKGTGGGCFTTGYNISNDFGEGAKIYGSKNLGYGVNYQCASIGDTGYLSPEWHQLVFVYSPSTQNKLYIDGTLSDINSENNCQSCLIQNSILPLVIGGYNSTGGGANWNGKIDDVGIWNRALTQQEVTNLFNANTTPPPCPSLPSNLQTGLVGYWPFCGNANDASSNGNNGTVNGATLTTDRFGNVNSAFDFNTSSKIIVPNSSSLTVGNALTISLWYTQRTMVNTINYLLQKGTGGGCFTTGYNISNDFGDGTKIYGSKNLGYGVNHQCASIGDTGYLSPEWHQLVFVYSPSTQNKLYIDGTLSDINSENKCQSCLIQNSISPLVIGGYNSTGGGANWNGKIDDVAIWNRALDSTEITQLYQTQSTFSSSGNVGVNVLVPQRNLHVNDVIRLETRTSPPDNPVIGDIYMDATLKKLRVYDGTQWQNCW